MNFNRGEIWKVDITIQPHQDDYLMVCPFVEIVNTTYNENPSTNVFAWAKVMAHSSGRIYTHIPFWFQPEGAMLEREAPNETEV